MLAELIRAIDFEAFENNLMDLLSVSQFYVK